ncbi:MAG: glycosyltransferase [Candidatus Nanopelagicales bacterium]
MLLPEVIPNRTGVKVDPPRAGRVVWIGRFLPIKAARLAISSFRWVLESQPTAELIMIGAGPTLEQNRSEASDLVLEGRLRFLGGLPWRQGQEILGSADVHLQTSVRDSSSAQAMEAASLGVPTVALKLGGMRDFFDDSSGAALIDPLPGWDVDRRLGDAVAALLGEGSRLRSERRGKALRFAEGYCVAARVNHLAETYGRLVSRP